MTARRCEWGCRLRSREAVHRHEKGAAHPVFARWTDDTRRGLTGPAEVTDPDGAAFMEQIVCTARVLTQNRTTGTGSKRYTPDVGCLAKGKARKPYGFGLKVSNTPAHTDGLEIGIRSMPGLPDNNPLAEARSQVAILCDAAPELAIVDRNYRRVALDGVKAYHPGLRLRITHKLNDHAIRFA